DLESGRILNTIDLGKDPENQITVTFLSVNEQWALIKTRYNKAVLVDVETGQHVTDLRISMPVRGAGFSPDGKLLVTTHSESPEVWLWDVEQLSVKLREVPR